MSVEAINLVNYSPYYVVLPNGSPEGWVTDNDRTLIVAVGSA